MKRNLYLYTVLVGCAMLAALSTNCFARLMELPADSVFPGLNGGELRGSELRKGFTIVEFFASWCPSCHRTMPIMAELAKSKGVRYLPISIDENAALGKSFFNRAAGSLREYEKLAYLDAKGTVARSLGLNSPSVVVLNPEGKVVAITSGHPSGSDFSRISSLLPQVAKK